MTLSSTQVLGLFKYRSNGRIPRGELWPGSELFARAGLENNLEGHFRMVDRLGQDLLSLSISNRTKLNRSTGYRYFNLADLKQAQTIGPAFLVVVIEGPFQRVFGEKGLGHILTRWHRDQNEFVQAYQKACAQVSDLVQRCLDRSIAAVVIADDLAGERSTIIHPKDIQGYFLPFYTQTVWQIHAAKATALFHSCGKIHGLIPMIESSGFDGLAAIQDRPNDMISIKEKHGALSIAMAGIDAEILEADELSASQLDGFCRRVRSLGASDGFVLGSCCGLYSGGFFERIQELYRSVDAIG